MAMATGWRYRVLGGAGTVVFSFLALVLANSPPLQEFTTTYVPFLSNLTPAVLDISNLGLVYLTTTTVVLMALSPMLKPKPRRILDVILATQYRTVIALLSLAAIGYYDYTYRLPRTTLTLFGAILLLVLPVWFAAIRLNPSSNTPAIIVGNDPDAMADIYRETVTKPLGYVGPNFEIPPHRADGGAVLSATSNRQGTISETIPRLGGLAKLEDILNSYEIETVYLGFTTADREDFFGALDKCHEHGVSVKVHQDHIDNVLTESTGSEKIVDVELEPLDPQDYVLKRLFDIGFAVTGLILTLPVALVTALLIKLDDGGPIFYKQQRTAEFGQRFTVFKFRSMTPEGESPDPVNDAENDRITRVGRFLRKTHLDEIPQLVAILTGEMSVVGPRAVWQKEETILQEKTNRWRRRWFIKPGLTGLAQIHSVTSEDPVEKLRLDLEYIRRQSITLDVKIVLRQIWMVVSDVLGLIIGQKED